MVVCSMHRLPCTHVPQHRPLGACAGCPASTPARVHLQACAALADVCAVLLAVPHPTLSHVRPTDRDAAGLPNVPGPPPTPAQAHPADVADLPKRAGLPSQPLRRHILQPCRCWSPKRAGLRSQPLRRYILQTYARPDIVFTHGEGARMYDAYGKEYLDFSAGIAVNALGECRCCVDDGGCAVVLRGKGIPRLLGRHRRERAG